MGIDPEVQDGLCVHEQHKLVDKVMFQLYELQDRAITAERRAANLEAALKKVRRQLRLRKETPPMIMASAAAEANREHSNRSSSTRLDQPKGWAFGSFLRSKANP
ncbi:unnamed protein product [Durusdinium trenchii]|uniref:Uncharacterized protein n=1 Tax=Durusdinium trenchii TaxID=1381693 RepID=A0ABP0LNJ8_9DINO